MKFSQSINGWRSLWMTTLVIALLYAAPQLALACPGCKDNLTAAHVNAYGWSIVFMMSMPFLILGSLSAYFYYEVRKARTLQAQNGVPARAGLETYSTPVPTSPGLGSHS